MAKMNIKRVSRPTSSARGAEPSYWKVIAIIAIIFSLGLVIKVVFFPSQATIINPSIQGGYQTSPRTSDPLNSQVQLVAANFRCACGGCGELPLIDCTCDMPRGAVEEKAFIRDKLENGLTLEQIIPLVEKKYGHKIS